MVNYRRGWNFHGRPCTRAERKSVEGGKFVLALAKAAGGPGAAAIGGCQRAYFFAHVRPVA